MVATTVSEEERAQLLSTDYLSSSNDGSKNMYGRSLSVAAGHLWPPQKLLRRSRVYFYALTPSILRHFLFGDDLVLPKVGPTTWMDGLRGWAALFVFNFHFFSVFLTGVKVGYGYDKHHTALLELPFIRILYDGGTCVNIFFVVSGYVCSIGALRLMTTHQHEKLVVNLSGSVFRRFFRLYLPTMFVAFVAAIGAYYGLFEYMRPLVEQRKTLFLGGLAEEQLKQAPTLYRQLQFWAKEMHELGNIWKEGPFYPVHDPHFWTIQYEFRMSMHLYIILFALAKCKPLVRVGWLCVLSAIYLYYDRWEAPLFFLGAAMAQLDILRNLQRTELSIEPNEKGTLKQSRPRSWVRMLRFVMYILALYFMSYPISNMARPAPGFKWVNALIPSWYKRSEKLPKSVGVLLLFYLLTTSSRPITSNNPNLWHRILTCKTARYLAKNMFAIYLVHGNVLHIIGYAFPHMFWRAFDKNTLLGQYIGLGLGGTMALLLTLWVADVFTREVDARVGNLVKWLERKCFVD